MQRHQIERKRYEARRRSVVVAAIEELTPNMLRINFTCADFADFKSASPDDHIKLFFSPAGSVVERSCMRDFTPRRFDVASGVLTIDFAIHDDGPATSWATNAKVGDTLEIGGPRGSVVVPDDFDWYLLIGDDTALPAIGRRLEELRSGVDVTSLVFLRDAADAQEISTETCWAPRWVTRRRDADDQDTLLSALSEIKLPNGDGYVWIAAESELARAVRTHVIENLGHRREWTKAAGYWTKGHPDAHARIED